MYSADCEQKSQRAGCNTDQCAFGEQLASQAQAAGAQGRAHHQLLLPLRRSAQEKIRHIGASDQQNEANGAEKDQQQRPHVLDIGGLQRKQAHALPLIFFRRLSLDAARDGVELGLRLQQAGVRFETRDHVHKTVRAAGIGRLRPD